MSIVPVFACPAAHVDRTLFDYNGLTISYVGTATLPSVLINGPDGEIELVGETEIHDAAVALARGARMAENFGPRLDFDVWRKWRKGAP